MKAIMRDKAELRDSGIEWIGDIPSNWNVVKIRNVIVQGKNGIKIGPFGSALTNKTSGDAEYKIYGQANLVSGDFSDTKNKISKETFIELQNYEVVPNDICISMMGTIGKCLTVPLGISKGIMDSHLIKIQLKATVDNRFFEYVYDKDKGGICYTQMQYEKKGSIMDGLNTTIVKGLYLPFPSLEEQTNIANYLDDCCSKIDAIIAEAKASIEEYKDLKQAVIYEAVTKGLDKNVEMKDSGIEWIGKIPKHYQFIKLKYLVTRSITDGTHNTPEYDSPLSGSPFLSSKDITKGYIDWSNIKYITKSLHEKLQKEIAPQKNDILLAKNGTTGIAAVVDTDEKFDIYVTLAVIRPNQKTVISQYLYYVINSWVAKRQFNDHLIGIGVPNLHLNVINNTKVILPPIDEQKIIIKHLYNECEKLDALITTKQSLIEDLESYKKSLIYEVVTGKRKVVE